MRDKYEYLVIHENSSHSFLCYVSKKEAQEYFGEALGWSDEGYDEIQALELGEVHTDCPDITVIKVRS